MVGRTPEYLGKKIEVREMKLAMLAVLIIPCSSSASAPRCCCRPRSTASAKRPARPVGDPLCLRLDGGQQRLGLRRPQRQYALVQHDGRPRNVLGRFAYVSAGAGAGRIARGEEEGPALGRDLPDRRAAVRRPAVGVIVILYLLQYFPALSLGPIVEHFLMLAGKTF